MWIKVFIDWMHRLEWVISHNGDYYPAHIRKANVDIGISLQTTPNEDPQTPENPASQPESLLFQPERILFQNSGNICYLNALLQCLLSISTFRCFSLHEIDIITQKDEMKKKLNNNPCPGNTTTKDLSLLW